MHLFNINLNDLDFENSTPIYYAIESKNIDLVEFLIINNVDIEHKDI